MRVTTAAIRNFDKAGGVQQYLLYTRAKDLGSTFGVELQQKLRERFREVTGLKFERAYRSRNDEALAKFMASRSQ